MFLARRAAAAPARNLLRRQQPRRFESSGHHGEEHHHHSEPVNESFGRGFYIAIASVPIAFAAHKFFISEATETPWLTRVIHEYTDQANTSWEKQNHLHTVALEKAAKDRALFQSQDGNVTIDLNFPEVFNTGSPINVSPGHGSADLRPVVDHYNKKRQEVEEKRVVRLQDGNVESIYEDDRYF